MDAVSFQRGQRSIPGVCSDRDEQSTGRLRVKQQILILGRYPRIECGAVADERAIVFQASGEMPLPRRLDRSWQILKGGVIELKRYRRNAVRRIAESHLPPVAQKTETRYIRYRVNQPPAAFFL